MLNCSIVDCIRTHYAKTYCRLHYRRMMRGADLNAPIMHQGEWTKWIVHSSGYVERTRRVDGKQEKQSQHRHVMEQFLGRKLLKYENVHHKNGNRSDNRLKNLELWSSFQPSGQRVEDKLTWAKEIIKLYG